MIKKFNVYKIAPTPDGLKLKFFGSFNSKIDAEIHIETRTDRDGFTILEVYKN